MDLSPEQQQIVDTVRAEVHRILAGAEGGHDRFHTERVVVAARKIALEEGADLFTVELAALLHDVDDAKFNGGDEEAGALRAGEILGRAGVAVEITRHIQQIIRSVSFRGGAVQQEISSPEFKAVQDADRLDAMGAVGIARAFSYGGSRQRALYDPDAPPQSGLTPVQYRSSTAPTVNHFYEKLLLLRDRMNTAAGRRMAEARHNYMLEFLERFFYEWYGGSPPPDLFVSREPGQDSALSGGKR